MPPHLFHPSPVVVIGPLSFSNVVILPPDCTPICCCSPDMAAQQTREKSDF